MVADCLGRFGAYQYLRPQTEPSAHHGEVIKRSHAAGLKVRPSSPWSVGDGRDEEGMGRMPIGYDLPDLRAMASTTRRESLTADASAFTLLPIDSQKGRDTMRNTKRYDLRARAPTTPHRNLLTVDASSLTCSPTGAQDSRDIMWVTKRYDPTDLRTMAPIQQRKPVTAEASDLPRPPAAWTRHSLPSRHSLPYRDKPQGVFRSQACTRSEDWSTLRAMLPSSGRPAWSKPPNWGTGQGPPPGTTDDMQQIFPRYYSPMSRYVDVMYVPHRQLNIF